MSTRSRLATVTGALVAAAAATALVAPAASAAEPGSGVTGTVEHSLVQVTVDFAGLIGRPGVLGTFRWTSVPTIAEQTCSGFFVTGSGHIMTAGHCVDPAQARETLIKKYLSDQVSLGAMSASEARATLPDALAHWNVQGPTPGSEVQRRIEVGQPRELTGAVLKAPQPARLMDFESFTNGDLALLKVERTGTPALPVASADPETGATVTSAGFPGSVSDAVDPNLIQASFTSGSVSSHQVSKGGVAKIEINADLAPGMSGGPTVDANGVALGVNSSLIEGGQSFNFITDTTDLRDWLATQGLTTPDQAPRGANPAALLVDGKDVRNASLTSGDGAGSAPWVLASLLGAIGLGAAGAGVLRARRRRGGADATRVVPTGAAHGGPAGPARPGAAAGGRMRTGSIRNGSALHSSTQHGPALHGSTQHGADRNGADRNGADRNGSAQHGAVQQGPVQHGPVRNGATWTPAAPAAPADALPNPAPPTVQAPNTPIRSASGRGPIAPAPANAGTVLLARPGCTRCGSVGGNRCPACTPVR
ncbi:hypothetical protein GCM10009836_04400 [Pseudonocardia ailaonensis]|uniref:Peptidase S1 domain-containing protein n=1 Tax=Pseudonocardia ailaonensis TaxID=367279 RepID=A0ABN2MMU6_9PSEU